MNLTERLEQAKLERELAAGTRHSSEALKAEPEPGPAPVSNEDTFDISIEVRPIGLAPVVDTIGSDQPILFGTASPSSSETAERCPNCNRFGHVDLVDLVGHRTHFTCDGCGAMWNVYDEDVAGHHYSG